MFRWVLLGMAACALLVCPNARAQPEGVDGAAVGPLAAVEEGDPAAERHFDIYGFADFTYARLLGEFDTPWALYVPTYDSFSVGNLNFYVAANLNERLRSLIEVRLMYLPNGASVTDPATGAITRTNTTVPDYSRAAASIRWGGISIQRAFLEYELDPLLVLRVGHWLTPVGIWNVDHGSPVIVGVRPPVVMSASLFPGSQTGVSASGSLAIADHDLSYELTLSNGRGPADTVQDLDVDKAVGGRVVFVGRWLGELQLGASAYLGRFTSRLEQLVQTVGADGLDLRVRSAVDLQYDERAWACDLRWQWADLLVQGELLRNDRSYTGRGRPMRMGAAGPEPTPDHAYTGGYGLVGYRTPWWGVMPYVIVEHIRIGGRVIPVDHISGLLAGLNVRPVPYLVLKVQLATARGLSDTVARFERTPLRIVEAQVAWVF